VRAHLKVNRSRVWTQRALAICLLVALLCLGCSGRRPSTAGLGPIAPCTGPPTCLSSEANIGPRYVRPFVLNVGAEEAWRVVVEVVSEMPRTRIVAQNDRALHAEVTSFLFRFVDDLELRLRPEDGEIDIRSASRTGYGDMGANVRRVNTLRSELVARGVILPANPGGFD
jgi:uncharacterized protein (DUF1499 family)